jgi:type VI secretion system secreted protein Hcp
MAIDMFIKIGDIAGESVDSVHAGSIDVLAWSWGGSQSGTTHTGGGGGAGKVSINDLSITKWLEKSSPVLLGYLCKGQHIPECLLTVRKAGGAAPVEYVKIKMIDCIITSLSTGGSGGEDRLTENVTINFARFQLDYSGQKKDGTAEAAITATWNIEQNKEAIT